MDTPGEKGRFRVLDLAEGASGFCSKVLADLGAEVIKVEPPGGDPSRRVGPFWSDVSGPNISLSFYYHNAGKRGITLNLKEPAGREVFRKLLLHADVVVESFPPGAMGVDFPTLQAANPRLILASITGFGQDGPRNSFKSCDLIASAFGGPMYLCGSPGRPPLKPPGEQSCYTASLFGAVAILLARRRVANTGKGCHIDLSLQEASAATLEQELARYTLERQTPSRQGSLYGDKAFAVCPCRDGHIVITPLRNWETLVEWMAADGMAGDLQEEPWQEESYRRDHFDHILEVLHRWTRRQPVQRLFELAQLMRFPWAPVQSLNEVIRDPQLRARNFFLEIPLSGKGPVPLPGSPYRFDGVRMASPRRPLSVGEHNREVYGHLGLTDQDLSDLASRGVI